MEKTEIYYIINKSKNYLASSSWQSEFCQGLRGFSKNGALTFRTKEHAIKYISNMLVELDKWINGDITEQAKNWREGDDVPYFNTRKCFLDESYNQYLKNKKAIESLKIINYFY